jgi:hypothetical protein
MQPMDENPYRVPQSDDSPVSTREDQPFLSFEFALFDCLYEVFCALWAFGLAVDGIVRSFLHSPVA